MVLRKRHSAQKGMTLLETSIALGAILLITAAVWTASSSVRHKAHLTQTAQDVQEIAALVRGAYVGFPSASFPATVSLQIGKGLFPPHVLNAAGTDTLNAWGGNYTLAFSSRGVVVGISLPLSFDVGTSREICVSLASQTPAYGTNVGTLTALLAAPPAGNGAQGDVPSHVFINDQDVTGSTLSAKLSAAGTQCLSVDFYFPF